MSSHTSPRLNVGGHVTPDNDWGETLFRRTTRRALTLGAATVTATLLAIAPASAHFCFKTNLNDHARAGMLGSANWIAFEDLAAEVTGLCPAGVQILADAAGVSLDTPINGHGLMAGGTLKKGGGNPAISHLDFVAIDAAFPDAVTACG
ncbi:MAG: hypothetical protein ACRDO2_10175 [Nocardioidaceae bacterium]